MIKMFKVSSLISFLSYHDLQPHVLKAPLGPVESEVQPIILFLAY